MRPLDGGSRTPGRPLTAHETRHRLALLRSVSPVTRLTQGACVLYVPCSIRPPPFDPWQRARSPGTSSPPVKSASPTCSPTTRPCTSAKPRTCTAPSWPAPTSTLWVSARRRRPGPRPPEPGTGARETRGGFASRPAMGLYTETDLASAHGLWPRSPARTVTSAPPIPVTLTWVGAGCFEWHMSFLT